MDDGMVGVMEKWNHGMRGWRPNRRCFTAGEVEENGKRGVVILIPPKVATDLQPREVVVRELTYWLP